ncbi:MAG: exodeoxyribonuclease VII large subunit [Bacteroidales bacterium]|jgi:exodeoxyribonuclease VII large subunit
MTEKISLIELQHIIKDSLYMALPDYYWVIAEISEIKENSVGHCYLELIEKLPDEKDPKAKIKGIIWCSRFRFIKPFFENITGETLREGMKILVRVKVEYHELYGLSLVISDIDPSFTVGEMALKREAIIKQLGEEGVFTMNKELSFPAFPMRIAVISSGTAAGYSDFKSQLIKNSCGYVFYTALFETVMQGKETEESVISALDRIAEHSDMFDLVAIIRGGGSQSDLSWFDNYNIAFHVTQFPLPVITGIGHEKDISVTDMVAYQSLKTPTAVADYLIEKAANEEASLKEMISAIAEFSREIVNDGMKTVESFRSNLVPDARFVISGNRELLSGKIIKMIDLGKGLILKAGIVPANQRYRIRSVTMTYSADKRSMLAEQRSDLMDSSKITLEKLKRKTESLKEALRILDPASVLRRGYTITTLHGIIVKSVGEINLEDIIDTHFANGKLSSKVIKK